MFCTKCGAPLKDGLKFCTSCGAKVENPVEEAQPSHPTKKQAPTGWKSILASAVLALVTLTVALGVFFWASAPRTSKSEAKRS